MRQIGQISTELAALLLLHAAGAGLASPNILITRPSSAIEWLPRDNQTLYKLDPGKSKRLELNCSSIKQSAVFITISPCAKDIRWVLYRGLTRGTNGHTTFTEEQKGDDFATISIVVSENERYVLQLTSIIGGAVAVSVRGERPKFSRMRLRVRSKRRLAALWDPSPIDPQATSYCVVASTSKNYTSLCAANFDARNYQHYKNSASSEEKRVEYSNENTSKYELDNKIEVDVTAFNIYGLKHFRKQKFSRSTKANEQDPVIACVGERTKHFIENLNTSAAYYVSIFGVAKDRRNGALLASGRYHPRPAVAKHLRENIPYKMEVRGRLVFYFKATLGYGGGLWVSATTCGGSVDVEVSVRGKRLYFIKNIDPHQSFFVPAPLMTSSIQETSDEGSFQFDSSSSEETRLRYIITVSPSQMSDHAAIGLEITASTSRWGPGTPQLVDDGIVRELRPLRTCRSVDIAFLPAVENNTDTLRYCITTREKITGSFNSCAFQMKSISGTQCLIQSQENKVPVIVQKVTNLRPAKKYEIQVTASNSRSTVPYRTLFADTYPVC